MAFSMELTCPYFPSISLYLVVVAVLSGATFILFFLLGVDFGNYLVILLFISIASWYIVLH